jgi:hypothetical protein
LEVTQFQPLTGDTIYVPAANQIQTVTTGAANWASGDFATSMGNSLGQGDYFPAAVAGSNVIFVSGTRVLAQSH